MIWDLLTGIHSIVGAVLFVAGIFWVWFWIRTGFWLPRYAHIMAGIATLVGVAMAFMVGPDAPIIRAAGTAGYVIIVAIFPGLVYFSFVFLGGQHAARMRTVQETERQRPSKMAQPSIAPGDKVVDLAALLRSAALFTGAITSAVSLWVLKQSAPWTLAAAVLGGVVGFFLGSLLGPVFFPAPAGEVRVVKLGPGALRLALKAGLIGGICSGVLAGLVPPLMLSQTPRVAQLAGTGVVIGIVIGAASAYIATRL